MITAANKSPKERNVLQTLYLSSDQNRELVTQIGTVAVVVYTHYVAIAHQTNPNMEDEHIAKLTGLSERAVQRTRLKLTKLGWFLRIRNMYKGEPQVTYLVGKEAVRNRNRAVLTKH